LKCSPAVQSSFAASLCGVALGEVEGGVSNLEEVGDGSVVEADPDASSK